MDERPQPGCHGQDETEDESANFPTFRIHIDSLSRIYQVQDEKSLITLFNSVCVKHEQKFLDCEYHNFLARGKMVQIIEMVN